MMFSQYYLFLILNFYHKVPYIDIYSLSNSHSHKQILKTEPELNVLQNFLDWLSKLQSKHGKPDGIMLLYHEEQNFIPHMVLQAFLKHSLLDEFNKIIKCFLNCNNLAKTYLGDPTYTYLGLSKLSELLSMSKENAKYKKGCARMRARMVFNVALQLVNRDRNPDTQSFENINNLYFILKPFTENIEDHLKTLDTETENLKREETFRPVFINYLENSVQRARALKFRMSLAENGVDLHMLHNMWRDKRQEGIMGILRSLDDFTSKQKAELVGLLDSYFDPRKDVFKPPARVPRARRRLTTDAEQTPETGDGASTVRFKADENETLAKGPKDSGKTMKSSRKRSTADGTAKSSSSTMSSKK